MTQRPERRRLRGISPIWTLPLITLIICASLLWTSWQNAGIEVTLLVKSASGITAGKTEVMVRGIPVGTVKSISPDIKQSRVVVTLKMDPQMKDALVEDTIFWVVRPQLSASSVSGLETILSGSYIDVQIGSSEVSRRHYIAAEEQPPPPENTPGLHLQLKAETLGSVQVGSEIYFRNIPIGSVEQTRLQGDAGVLIKVLIQPRYARLVRTGSRFCNASGFSMQGSLSSVQVHMESVAALLRGGIQLFTPKAEEKSAQAENGTTYTLYKNYAAAEYGLPLTLLLSSSEGIVEGVTKVMFRGFETGVVKSIEIKDDHGNPKILAHILLDPRAEPILRRTTRFWMVRPEIGPSGVKNLSGLLSGAYITFTIGSGEFCNSFALQPDAPPQLPLRPGLSFVLTSEEAAQVTARSPLFFKNIKVGEVVAVHLSGDGRELRTRLFIYEEYLHLVNSSSVFWLQSGIKIKADAKNGLTVDTGPLTSMLFGGISFATPGRGEPLQEGQNFPLYSGYGAAAAATPVLQKEGRLITLLADNGASLTAGAPILYKSIQIGEIRDFRLDKNEKVQIDALIYHGFDHLVTDRSRFCYGGGVQVNAGMNGIQVQSGSLLSMAAGGIDLINLQGAWPKRKGTPWRLYKNRTEAEEADCFGITVTLPASQDLRVGSKVLYKGIDIGHVLSLQLDKELKNVEARVRIKREARKLFREGTMVWVSGAELALTEMKDPQALLFGPHLALLPGGGKPSNSYIALDKAPLGDIANAEGLGVVLETTHLGSISTGSPIYYREIQVGSVTGYELSPTFQKVQIYASIKRRFAPIIRKSTKFWNISGARIQGGIFSGVTVQTGSLESIIKGGIAFATPDDKKVAPRVTPGQVFPLHDAPDEEWLDWKPNVQIFEKEDAGKYLQKKG